MVLSTEDYANEVPPSSRLGDLSGSLSSIPKEAPIDLFLRDLRAALSYGTPTTVSANEFIGRLLVLSIVSSAESYFRSTLSNVIEVCPRAQELSAEKSVHLGGVLWHGTSGYSKTAFEHLSFASAAELRKATKDFVGFKLEDTKFADPLSEFDKVCQIRHAIVHNGGVVPGKNALQLQLPRVGCQQKFVLDYAILQDVASIISGLVVTFNRELFSEMCRRWAVVWRQRSDWTPADEQTKFNRIWFNFHSKEELSTRVGRTRITRRKCLEDVKAEYDL